MSGLKFNILNLLLYLFLLLFMLSGEIHSQYKGSAKAKIIMNSYSAEKDSSLEIGVLIELAKDWHIYWLNPGDSGIPTSIYWNIPKGFQFIEEHWPIPKAFEYEGLVSYGYANQVLFIIEIVLPKKDNSQILNISANIKSLLCKEICIPFDTTVNFIVDLHKNYSPDETITEIFDQTRKNLPITTNNKGFSAGIISDDIYLRIDVSSDYYCYSTMNFIPYENGLFKNSLNQSLVRDKNYLKIILEPDQFRIENPKELYGLLISNLNGDESIPRKVFEVKIPILK